MHSKNSITNHDYLLAPLLCKFLQCDIGRLAILVTGIPVGSRTEQLVRYDVEFGVTA